MEFSRLRSVHDGETCYVVGKGPSLEHLSVEHLGPGPIITLNQALLAVEALSPPNPLYSMQKDGCRALIQQEGGCEECDGQRLHMTYPERETTSLLLHFHESRFCLPYHGRRYVFDAVGDLGLDLFTRTSAMCAVRIAQFMGCREIVFVSMDSIATGDTRTFTPGLDGPEVDSLSAADYEIAREWLLDLVADFPHRFMTPPGAPVDPSALGADS